MLLVDASHAGAAAAAQPPDMNKVVNDFSTAGSGLVVFAASTGTEVAREDAKWDRHGAFAKALIEAIAEGKAWIDRAGGSPPTCSTSMSVDHVKIMTDGRQHPVMNRAGPCPRFPDRGGAALSEFI